MTYGCCLGDCGRKCSIVSSIHIIIVGLVHLDTKVWLQLGSEEIYGYLAGNSFYRLVGVPDLIVYILAWKQWSRGI